jgi:hypothetical protein
MMISKSDDDDDLEHPAERVDGGGGSNIRGEVPRQAEQNRWARHQFNCDSGGHLMDTWARH